MGRSRTRTLTDEVGREELFRHVRVRRRQVRRFLNWANQKEAKSESLRWNARRDINEAREASGWFSEPWWGVVVFTCFGSLRSAKVVSESFHGPVGGRDAGRRLAKISFPRGSVGHHRIRPGLTGAKQALIAACERARDFKKILLRGDGFHARYEELRELRAAQWGRTTCFDLLLRTGAMEVGGSRYAPDRAYLGDSTGPKHGFEKVWGIGVTRQNVEWCEGLLRAWTENWCPVAVKVGATWDGVPYVPADFENALCVYQERVRRQRC